MRMASYQFVRYKGKTWNLLVPKNLTFEAGCIRNILIERKGKKVITNLKSVKIIKEKYKTMEVFLNGKRHGKNNFDSGP